MHAVLFSFGDIHQSLLNVHAFLTFEINFQTICGFTTGRLITVITQQYIPFYLLDSLNLPKVNKPTYIGITDISLPSDKYSNRTTGVVRICICCFVFCAED